jgi:predicted nucleic acid-binding protein
MSFLLDTNVVSTARRSAGHAGVRAWLRSVPAADLFVSVLVVGELRRGVEQLRRRDPQQAAVLEAWLLRLVADYRDRVLPVTAAVAEEWGRLNAPDRLPVVDGLLAATARVHGLVLVTRNTADFARTGVRLLNPFGGVQGDPTKSS